MSQPFIEGMLLREIFRNSDNDFAICSLLLTGHNASEDILNAAIKPVSESDIPNGFDADELGAVSISGYFPKLDTTRSYRFTGKWHDHPRYGMQFQVATFESKQVAISSDVATIAYLSSSTFKGIGKKAAASIVAALGADAVNLILKDATVLNSVTGISQKQKDVLVTTIKERQGDELVLGPLYSYGISPKFVVKILKLYEKDALTIIQANPYKLTQDIEGIGFIKADEIAQAVGIQKDDPRRIRAAILHVMNRMSTVDGHTFATCDQLTDMALHFLNKDASVTETVVQREIAGLVNNDQLASDEQRLFLPVLLNAELRVARAIELLKKELLAKDAKAVSQAFNRVKTKIDINYSLHQEAAILTSLQSPVSIITGGPGTGKTTVVNGILKTYDELYKNVKKERVIKLASPTGRAAKRVAETTKREATTIHRLLGYDRDGTFKVSEEDPLTADLVIIDEVSMLDTYLANQLLTSLQAGTQIIFVGDDNQLPSVGPGQVLADLIKSDKIPLTRLTEIHRQAEDSTVITLAHEINHGRLPVDLAEKKSDRLFVPANNEDILRLLKQVTTGAIAKGYTAKEVQILIPMYRGTLGIDAVNVALQELFNPATNGKTQLIIGQKTFREGDKVLQLVNNPDEDVMNGDVGEIIRITSAGAKSAVLVDFDGNEVAYNREDLSALTHAYAMSIHKSQGSEYPVVIMPITRAYWIMLQRKLIYTGITRAKKSLILIGDYQALEYAAKNQGSVRQTTLNERLIGKTTFGATVATKTNALQTGANPYADYFAEHNIPFEQLDEAGLEGRTPHDMM